MTLDKTLQKIIQRAEFDVDRLHDFWLCHTTEDDIESAKFENSRLMPIIKGLCEEVQRLTNSLKFFSEGIVVGNIPHIGPVTISGTKAKADLALSTSELEKLGGGDD